MGVEEAVWEPECMEDSRWGAPGRQAAGQWSRWPVAGAGRRVARWRRRPSGSGSEGGGGDVLQAAIRTERPVASV